MRSAPSCQHSGRDDDLYAQGPGSRWHLRILDVEGNRIIIVVGDYSATPTADQPAAQAIVDSIQIRP